MRIYFKRMRREGVMAVRLVLREASVSRVARWHTRKGFSKNVKKSGPLTMGDRGQVLV